MTYNPKTRSEDTGASTFGRSPVIAYSPDRSYALAVYSPQMALAGEAIDGNNGYLRTVFTTGLNTLMNYIRYDYMPAGSYKFKSYYIVGTLDQVKSSIDRLYEFFSILDPKVFKWNEYTAANRLGSMSEDQARLHWVTTGINLGLRSSNQFSVKDYLANNSAASRKFGTNYYEAAIDYVKK